jgi:hypothetical protein
MKKYSIIYRVRGSQVTDYIWYDSEQKIMFMKFKSTDNFYLYFNVEPNDVNLLVGVWPQIIGSSWYGPNDPRNYTSTRWFNADPHELYPDITEEQEIKTKTLGYHFNKVFRNAHPMYLRLSNDSIIKNYIKSNKARRENFLNAIRTKFNQNLAE